MNRQTQTRYSDAELEVFRNLINSKLENATLDLEFLIEEIREANESGDAIKVGDWEEGSKTAELEYLSQMAARKQQYIKHLKNALIRISNKTYGICSVTGEMISKERLMVVPHATKSVLGKEIENSKSQS